MLKEIPLLQHNDAAYTCSRLMDHLLPNPVDNRSAKGKSLKTDVFRDYFSVPSFKIVVSQMRKILILRNNKFIFQIRAGKMLYPSNFNEVISLFLHNFFVNGVEIVF